MKQQQEVLPTNNPTKNQHIQTKIKPLYAPAGLSSRRAAEVLDSLATLLVSGLNEHEVISIVLRVDAPAKQVEFIIANNSEVSSDTQDQLVDIWDSYGSYIGSVS